MSSKTTTRMTHLFQQLGLDSSEAAIAQFIEQHQLAAPVYISEANFWTTAQSQFIREHMKSDDDWAIVIDQLNESLHEASVKKL
ncbi:MAG TPA: DUF2789 domain-containing protein [Acinetobacter radioresistens]|nr:DUF2789 domain-containing protein [Acinetobacter radioresistens]